MWQRTQVLITVVGQLMISPDYSQCASQFTSQCAMASQYASQCELTGIVTGTRSRIYIE